MPQVSRPDAPPPTPPISTASARNSAASPVCSRRCTVVRSSAVASGSGRGRRRWYRLFVFARARHTLRVQLPSEQLLPIVRLGSGSSWLTFPHPRRTSKETRQKSRRQPCTAPHAHNCDADRCVDDDTRHDIDRQADDYGDGTRYDSHGRHGRNSADGGPDGKVCQ